MLNAPRTDSATLSLIKLVEKLRRENTQVLVELDKARQLKDKYRQKAHQLADILEAERLSTERDAGQITDLTLQLKNLVEEKDAELQRTSKGLDEAKEAALRLREKVRTLQDELAERDGALDRTTTQVASLQRSLARATRAAEIERTVTQTQNSTLATADSDLQYMKANIEVAYDTIEKLLAAISALAPSQVDLRRICSVFDRKKVLPVFLDSAKTTLSLSAVKHSRLLEPKDSDGGFIPMRAYRYMSLYASRNGLNEPQARELLLTLGAYFKEYEQEVKDAQVASLRSECLELKRKLRQKVPYDAVRAHDELEKAKIEMKRYKDLYERLAAARGPKSVRVKVTDADDPLARNTDLGMLRAEMLKLRALVEVLSDVGASTSLLGHGATTGANKPGSSSSGGGSSPGGNSAAFSLVSGQDVSRLPPRDSVEFLPFVSGSIQVGRVLVREIEALGDKVSRISKSFLADLQVQTAQQATRLTGCAIPERADGGFTDPLRTRGEGDPEDSIGLPLYAPSGEPGRTGAVINAGVELVGQVEDFVEDLGKLISRTTERCRAVLMTVLQAAEDALDE